MAWALTAGAVAGALPQLLMVPIIYNYALFTSVLRIEVQPRQFGVAMALWDLPAMQTLLVFFAASWTARGVGEEPVRHGIWVALVAVVAGQLAGAFYGPLSPVDLAK